MASLRRIVVKKKLVFNLIIGAVMGASSTAQANVSESNCNDLPSHADLQTALDAAVATETSGLNADMWATLVNRNGVVCAVAFSGEDSGDQWLGSRAISAQKANTANAFSLPDGSGSISGLSLSTANLFSAVQPGGSLFGLQHSNPVDTTVVYKGPAKDFGTPNDPMVGKKPGGVNVFGGGLALYDEDQEIVGAVGLSGDTSCADHFIAWRVRNNLELDYVPAGVSGDADRPDNIIFDIVTVAGHPLGISAGGFGHATCINTGVETDLPPVSVP